MTSFSQQSKALQRSVITAALVGAHGNVSKAARVLELTRAGLYKIFARLGINPSDYRPKEPTP